MKSNWILFCLLLLLSLTAYPQEFQINIDAQKDAYYNTLHGPNDGWLYIPPEAFNNNGSTTDPGPADEVDLSANWYSAWDETYLYVYVEVTDDIVRQDNATNYWANDCFDAKMDPDYTNTVAVNEVFCFAMTCMDSADVDASLYGGIGNIVETVGGGWVLGTDSTAYKSVTPDDYARQITETGYILECRVKWEWIATTSKAPIAAEVGGTYGFAVSISDNDESSTRNNSIEWAAQLLDNVWTSCTNHGNIELLADHKIKYVPESLRDPSIVNPNPDMYIPAGTDVSQESGIVKNFVLSQNYPNPFNPVTTILYTIPKLSDVKIGVYDLLGNEVAILVNGVKPAGTYTAKFDGSNLSSGIYFYKLQSEGKVISKKMALLK